MKETTQLKELLRETLKEELISEKKLRKPSRFKKPTSPSTSPSATSDEEKYDKEEEEDMADPYKPDEGGEDTSKSEEDGEQPESEEDERSWEEINKPETSGTWEKLKYLSSMFGRYKVNGKFFGKKKELKASRERIKNLLEKESNKQIKQLDELIKKNNPEFPNNLKSADFLSNILLISSVYDSIVEATTKQGEGYLEPNTANALINDLREYVKHVLDAELKASYSTVDESVGSQNNLTKEDLRRIDEAFGLINVNLEEDIESDVRNKLKSDVEKNKALSKDDSDFKSTKVDTLKSNTLPLTLLGIGTSLGAFSWLVNTDWFKKLFEVTTTKTELVPAIEKSNIFTPIKNGEGVYKLLGRVTKYKLDGNSSPTEFINSLKEIGGGDAKEGVEKLCQRGGVMMKPDEAKKGLLEFLKNPSKFRNMNDLFHGTASGTGKLIPTNTTLYGTIAGTQLQSIITKVVMRQVVKTTVTTGGGYITAKGLGAWLGPIGITAVAAGVLVKLMRVKGQKTSRAATLNLLYQSLRNVPVPEEVQIVEPEGEVDNKIKTVDPTTVKIEPPTTTTGKPTAIDAKEPSEPKGEEKPTEPEKTAEKNGEKPTEPKSNTSKKQSADDDKLYIMLRDLFKEIVKNKKFGLKPTNNTNTSGKSTSAEKNKVKAAAKNKKAAEKIISKTEKPILEAIVDNPQVRQYLNAKLKSDKLEFFENMIERVKKIIEKIKETDITSYGNVKFSFSSNPLMYTNLDILFHKRKNEEDTEYKERLVKYINDFFVSLYSSSFKGGEKIVDKMDNLGGGNLDLLQELRSSKKTKTSPIKNNFNRTPDPQSTQKFKSSLLNFLRNAILLFQHLYNKKYKKK